MILCLETKHKGFFVAQKKQKKMALVLLDFEEIF
jgi:hypothetical protein